MSYTIPNLNQYIMMPRITFFSLIWAIICSHSIQAQQTTYTNLEEALKTPQQVTRLNLSEQKLKALPASLKQLKNLEYLDVSLNLFQGFPEVILSLKKLRTLKLYTNYGKYMRIHEIPAQITRLKQLRYLDISHLPLHKEPKVVYQLTNLEVLKMSSVIPIIDIKKTPRKPNTGGFRSSMQGAYALTLQGIRQLKKLKTLDISHQTWRMKTLPPEIAQLTSLETLDISSNWYKSLPVGIKNLQKLKHLNLNHTTEHLKNASIHLEFLGQLKLETLHLKYANNPASILNLLNHPAQLRTLNLSFCSLKKLPESLFRFTQLHTLDLSYNKLSNLPQNLAALVQLETLDISNNSFEKLPTAISNLARLKKLDCSRSFLCYPEKDLALPDNFGQLKNLEELNLRGNAINHFPASFGQMTRLKSLNIYGIVVTTQMATQLAQLTNLEYLEMTLDEKAQLPSTFKNLTKLKELAIAASYCEGVPTANYIAAFPVVICDLSALERLSLVGHEIKTIPPQIRQLQQLKLLSLYDNTLTTLPDELGELKALTYLNIDLYCIGNRYELCHQPLVLPTSLCKLKQLKDLKYGDRKIDLASLARVRQCLKLNSKD
ncbi:hypothetical protein BKI52_27370 [marine bacterium AO1-C]|nr:hypothetical protein BKI52_27370 [marine bacterium AO1-C]